MAILAHLVAIWWPLSAFLGSVWGILGYLVTIFSLTINYYNLFLLLTVTSATNGPYVRWRSAFLGSSWGILGLTFACPWIILGYLGPYVRLCSAFLGSSWAILGDLGPRLLYYNVINCVIYCAIYCITM